MGANYTVRVTVGRWTVLSSPSVVFSYGKPILSSVSGAVNMPTAGGSVMTITGVNFGSGVPFSLTFGMPGITPMFVAQSCLMTVPHSEVVCVSPPGVGVNHSWVFEVGGQVSVLTVLPTSYRRPIVLNVVIDGRTTLATSGSTTVAITGLEFGRGDVAITASYGPSASEYVVPCSLDAASNSTLHCTTQPGIGNDFAWTVTVASQESDPSSQRLSYAAPVFAATKAVSGPGAINGSTAGNQLVNIFGSNIGPLVLPASIKAEYIVTYGPTASVSVACSVCFVSPLRVASAFVAIVIRCNTRACVVYACVRCCVCSPSQEFVAEGCSSVKPEFLSLQCYSAPGTGRNHSWVMTTRVCAWDGVTATRCSSQSSAVARVGTGYAPPAVASIESDGVFSATSGNEVVIIRGACPLCVCASARVIVIVVAVLAASAVVAMPVMLR